MPDRNKNEVIGQDIPPKEDLGDEALRDRMRHSAAHVMAQAVLRLFPEAKLGIGPSIQDGFYYDFQVSRPFAPEDLDHIETLMKEVIAQDLPFECRQMDSLLAEKTLRDQPFKREIVQDIPEGEPISFYRHGDFEDLCEGPHVESTGKIIAFRLLHAAGAYWRGDEHRPMLQRIYGTAWESEQNLEEYMRRLEEAQTRDHRKLGRELDLFSIHQETGPGLIIWHPKGSRIRTVIEDHLRTEHYRHGYDMVHTPHLGRAQLWETSGHLDFYRDLMYGSMDVEGQQYFLKPMNCPFHIMIYQNAKRTYRELPIRLAELGTVYRYERSGVLHGLLRVRGFTQDDAHIFCRPDQVEDEILGVLDFTFELLKTFGFSKYDLVLSTRPAKFVGQAEDWDHATKSLEQAFQRRKLSYTVDDGGGAFYGPKIDIKITDAIGRSWQCTTVQFDFNLAERFNLTYVGVDGQAHRPFMVHRALLGSIERFFGILLEHYGGSFPTWLAPVQAVVIPIADRHKDYADHVNNLLADSGIRVNVDSRNERMNLKIREAQLQKIPYMLITGDKEALEKTVSVRLRNGQNPGTTPIDDAISLIREEIDTKR